MIVCPGESICVFVANVESQRIVVNQCYVALYSIEIAVHQRESPSSLMMEQLLFRQGRH